jgi:hypothetical protein
MVKSTIGLDVASQWQIKRLAPRYDPVEDRTFQALRVVRPCIGGTLLYLLQVRSY